jgi:hypothetical protein
MPPVPRADAGHQQEPYAVVASSYKNLVAAIE